MVAPRVLQIGLALSVVLLSSCCQSIRDVPGGRQQANENLDSVLWRHTSVEYRASAEQAYRWARIQLDAALEAGTAARTAALEQLGDYSELPPAIILDVDDTTLESSPFQARLVKSGRPFRRDLWNDWVREGISPAVPGVLEFVRYARAKGVKVFYVSNREYEVEDATRQNLEDVGFPVDADGSDILSKKERAEWGSDKTSRRAFIAQRYRILLIVGDDLNDFLSGAMSNPEERAELGSRYRSYWGEKWIVIPNPMYGSWERALYDHEMLPRSEKLRRKYRRLPTLGE